MSLNQLAPLFPAVVDANLTFSSDCLNETNSSEWKTGGYDMFPGIEDEGGSNEVMEGGSKSIDFFNDIF